ncbi:hypothetical protein LR066_04770 [candidate division WOR-3 bacterium]|nr:hypothetical protein [candidate division WOR-3 bacterium]
MRLFVPLFLLLTIYIVPASGEDLSLTDREIIEGLTSIGFFTHPIRYV